MAASAALAAGANAEEPRLFDSLRIEAGVHLGIPTGSLDGPYGPTPAYRLGMSSSWAVPLRAVGHIQYAPLRGDVDAHYLEAGCGLEFESPVGFSIGPMLSLHYARSLEEHSPPLQLDGGESEFGLDLRLGWSPPSWRKPGVILRSVASLAFTRPERSLWIWSGIDLTWEWP